MKNKIWGGKLIGILSAIIMFLSIIIDKIYFKLSSFFFSKNIKKCGKNVKIMIGCKYRYPGFIEVGDNVIIAKDTHLTSEVNSSKYLLIESGVSIGSNCQLDFSGGIFIRSNAHIAHNVLISTHDHGYDYRNEPVGKSIEIGESAFIGSEAIILHNCNYIGKYSVIGTGSVVTKDVPDYAIVAGNPAKVIKFIENGK